MSIVVVYRFELVQISHDDPKGKIVSHRAAQLFGCPLFNGAPVRQSSQVVREGQLFQKSILRFDFPVKLNEFPTDIRARQQLRWVERFSEVVIHSSLESGYDIRFLRQGGEQDHISERITEPGTEALAEFDPADVRHDPIGYDQSGTLLFEELESFESRCRGNDLEIVRWKGVLDQFAGDGRIVHQE